MDNVTHTLIGLAIGEAAVQMRAGVEKTPISKSTRAQFWILSAIANNFPDLDILYTPITEGKLGRLLHHSGHTHTFLFAPLLAALITGSYWLWLKLMRKDTKPVPWKWLGAVTLLGPFAHIGMDYMNSYGVHPFWPFDDRWYFGDTIFIVEPLFWLALLPALAFASSGISQKILFGLFSTAIGLLFLSGYVPWQLAFIGLLSSLWLMGLMFKVKPWLRISASLGTFAVVLATFSLSSAFARIQLEKIISKQFPNTTHHDLILSPMPANPICWTVYSVETSQNQYFVRRGIFSIAPHFMGAANCPSLLSSNTTAKLVDVTAPTRPELIWSGEFRAPASQLNELKKKSCGISALLQFTRAPVWVEKPDGHTIVSDLRFDRENGSGFATMEFSLQEQSRCPDHLPPWPSPRSKLF